jgi:hypothetical protein
MHKGLRLGLVAILFAPGVAFAQNGYFGDWFGRVDKTKDEQPHWVTPLATTTPRLEEEYRSTSYGRRMARGLPPTITMAARGWN